MRHIVRARQLFWKDSKSQIMGIKYLRMVFGCVFLQNDAMLGPFLSACLKGILYMKLQSINTHFLVQPLLSLSFCKWIVYMKSQSMNTHRNILKPENRVRKWLHSMFWTTSVERYFWRKVRKWWQPKKVEKCWKGDTPDFFWGWAVGKFLSVIH